MHGDRRRRLALIGVFPRWLDDPEGITPTFGFSQEKVQQGRYTLTFTDLGGGKTFRGIWHRYLAEVPHCSVHGWTGVYLVAWTYREMVCHADTAIFGPRYSRLCVTMVGARCGVSRGRLGPRSPH